MSIVSVDALYVGSERGLAAGMLAARAVGVSHQGVATMIASASLGRVTDITDVPADTVAAQLEHLNSTVDIGGVQFGALAGHAVAAHVLAFAKALGVPTVFNCTISGPTGETVLTSRGIETVRDQLGTPDLLSVGRLDAQLLTEGEINTLDDAQVAAQRLVKRGARAVVIRCGPLPSRFFEAQGAERPDATFNSDLYYDGEDFALFEAPHIEGVHSEGASAAFSVVALASLINGKNIPDALADAKRFATETFRATQALGPEAPLQYFWNRPPLTRP